VSQLNPFFHGVVLIGSIDAYGPLDLLRPIAILVIFNLVFVALGRWLAIRRIERD
jgi:hypothetical protein